MVKRGKCSLILLILLMFFMIISNTISQDLLNLDDAPVVKDVEKTREFVEQEKWKYLGEEWKKILLKNNFVNSIDSFLRRISIVFFVLFGENYEISLTLGFVILLWIFFLVNFSKILNYSIFSRNISIIISVGLAIILAQLGFLRFLSNLAFKVIFYREGVWSWVAFILFILLLVLIGFLIHAFGESAKTNRKKWHQERQRLEQEILHRTVGGLTRGFR